MQKLPALRIGQLEIDPPFILGGMGVRSTDHSLVSAVANLGMAGTIASVGLVEGVCRGDAYVAASNQGLINEIKESRRLSPKGVVGVNIMVALTNYEELVKTAISEKIDYIISGAGLPLNLPELAAGSSTCLIPIASSARSAELICRKWWKSYQYAPDAIIVEGALAGGHLGFKREETEAWTEDTLTQVCKEVIEVAKKYEQECGKHIPVIAAGGVYSGKDIAKLFKAGVEGVQMATRFLATDECSLPDNVKKVIVDSKKEDMHIINSPVGLPGRAVMNELIRRVTNGEKMPINCPYHCLRTCNPREAAFCIAEALVGAHAGDAEYGLIMAGYNAYRIEKVVPVKELVDELVSEAVEALNS